MTEQKPYLWWLHTVSKRGFSAADAWKNKNLGTIVCSRCRAFKPGSRPIDVTVQNEIFRGDICFVCGFTGFTIVSERLVETLGPHLIATNSLVGHVFHEDGTPFRGLRTLVPKTLPLQLRGGKMSECSVCPECGHIFYRTLDKRYLLPLPRVKSLYHERYGLLIRDDIYLKKLKGVHLRCVKIEKIPFRGSPIDGIPVDLKTLPLGAAYSIQPSKRKNDGFIPLVKKFAETKHEKKTGNNTGTRC